MLSGFNYFSNMDKNSKILLAIIAVIVFLLILLFIINHFFNRKLKKQERLRKQYTKRLNSEIERDRKLTEKIKKKEEPKIETVKEEILEIKEEPKVESEVIEVLVEENESDVDRILKDIKDASKQEDFNLTEFEREQEETAIISYDELCKRAGVKKKIYVSEAKQKEVKPIKKEEAYKGKYKPTKFISPIFGIQDDEKEKMSEAELDQTFLKSLKEFRSGLE